MEKYEEQVLANIGIHVRNADGELRPSEEIAQEFKELWHILTDDQRVLATFIILLIGRR